jgi:hypothetical protein
MMGTLADQYRRKADEATLAEMDAENPFSRRVFSKIAAHWHELADRVEHQKAAADTGEPLQPTEVVTKNPNEPGGADREGTF